MWSCGNILLQVVLYKTFTSVHIKAHQDCFFSCFFVIAECCLAGLLSPYFDYVLHGNHKNPLMLAITFKKNLSHLLLLFCIVYSCIMHRALNLILRKQCDQRWLEASNTVRELGQNYSIIAVSCSLFFPFDFETVFEKNLLYMSTFFISTWLHHVLGEFLFLPIFCCEYLSYCWALDSYLFLSFH